MLSIYLCASASGSGNNASSLRDYFSFPTVLLYYHISHVNLSSKPPFRSRQADPGCLLLDPVLVWVVPRYCNLNCWKSLIYLSDRNGSTPKQNPTVLFHHNQSQEYTKRKSSRIHGRLQPFCLQSTSFL
jgi:hypothetical protein